MYMYKLGQKDALETLGVVEDTTPGHLPLWKPVAGLAAAEVASRAVGQASSLSFRGPPVTDADMQTLKRTMGLSDDIWTEITNKRRSSYNPLTSEINVYRKFPIDVAAHEMGHATGRMVPGRMVGGLLGTMGLVNSVFTDNPDSTFSKATPWLASAGFLPVMAEEVRATTRATRALNSLGKGNPRKVLLPALAAYAAAGTLPGVLTEWLRRERSKQLSTPQQ